MKPEAFAWTNPSQGPAPWLASYPAHLVGTWTMASGESLCVRPLRHDDGALEEAFVRALSSESRYQRMLSAGVKVTPEWIDAMTHIDYRSHMAFAVTTVREGVEQFVGRRAVCDRRGDAQCGGGACAR